MLNRTIILLALGMSLCFACNKDKSEKAATEDPEATQPDSKIATTPPKEEAEVTPPAAGDKQASRFAAILVFYVDDFDTWRRKFGGTAPERKKAGVVAHSISRVLSDQDQVIVHLETEEVEPLKALIESKEWTSTMTAGGAGEVTSWTMEIVDEVPADGPTPGSKYTVFVTFGVEDFERWKGLVFDSDQDKRKAASVFTEFLGQGVGDKNTAFIVFRAADIEKFAAFVGTEERKTLAKEAGASPDVTVHVGSVIEMM